MSEARDRHLMHISTRAELTRREALKVLAASVAATQAACIERPGDEIRPYARLRAELTPGAPRHYATSMTLGGFATGLVVETHEGRPTKVEGNPEHPASLGASSAQHQASVLDLYDPCRAKAVARGSQPASWSALEQALARASGPRWLVLPESSSPLEAALVSRVCSADPRARVVTVGDNSMQSAYAGAELAFGRPLQTQLDLTRARVVVALDADLFCQHPMSLRWAHDFAARRRVPDAGANASRLYVIEPMLTPTGALADHRLALRGGAVIGLLLALAEALRDRHVPVPRLPTVSGPTLPERQQRIVQAMAADLSAETGAGIVVVGQRQPPECHALAHVVNEALGNLGATVRLTDPVLIPPPARGTLSDLTTALRSNEVGLVAVIDCNPVHSAPPELDLDQALRRAPLSVHFDSYRNETSAACHFHAPLSHYLESWGDARAGDGTLSFVQPVIRPLHATRDRVEVIALLAGEVRPRSRALLRAHFRAADESEPAFEARWHSALALGCVPDSAFPSRAARSSGISAQLDAALQRGLAQAGARHDGIEVNLAPSPTVRSARLSNNAWLQELPHPFTKQTWGNAALMSDALARQLGVVDGQHVRLLRGACSVELPVLCVAGHASDCVSVELGYGRRSSAEVMARGVGENGAILMREPEEYLVPEVSVRGVDRHSPLARTQSVLSQHGRTLAPLLSPGELQRHAAELARMRDDRESTLSRPLREGPQWAMTIDTGVCSGCSACVIACQSENNVPVVGKAEVQRGREMHWLRIDTYFTRHAEERVVHQPMMCQHCEHAPCEYVCPVFATEHSPDGLNEMTYNRCIGTRFCQANCPYKVRRFNWLNYTEAKGTLALQRNPQVTVRDRGVMEKCTYCVQRIRQEEYHARMERRPVEPRRVKTACQQACPTGAIQFGTLEERYTGRHPHEARRAYRVLNELGTRPRTQYLAKLYNPHPDLGDE